MRAIYAMALRLGVLPEQVFEMTEFDFALLMSACKLDADDHERSWRRQKHGS